MGSHSILLALSAGVEENAEMPAQPVSVLFEGKANYTQQ